jgi:hypothetical protein
VELDLEVDHRAPTRPLVLDGGDAMCGAHLTVYRKRAKELEVLFAVQEAQPVDAGGRVVLPESRPAERNALAWHGSPNFRAATWSRFMAGPFGRLEGAQERVGFECEANERSCVGIRTRVDGGMSPWRHENAECGGEA